MLTKLQAVNEMLDAINEAPVSSLSSGLPDAAKAERILDRVTDRILAAGWHCNTDYNYTFALESDGTIVIPSDVLRVDTMGDSRSVNVTERTIGATRLMYDVDNRTTVFTKSPKCIVIWSKPFIELTYDLQKYIAASAAVDFQVSELGSIPLDALTVRMRDMAWSLLIDAELESEDANPLHHNTSLHWAVYRNSPANTYS